MKVRCPYCQHVFPPSRRATCPACGKSVLPPNFFGSGGRAAAGPHRPRPAQAPFPLASRPMLIFSALLILSLAALPLVFRNIRPPQEPSHAYRRQLAFENMTVLSTALQLLYRDCQRFPTTAEDLVSLVHNPDMPGWNGPYVIELKPDPWGRRFLYESDGKTFRLSSAGADGIPGTQEDIALAGSAPSIE